MIIFELFAYNEFDYLEYVLMSDASFLSLINIKAVFQSMFPS